MRKIITTTFVTLDGVMQAPGGPEEDASGGFKYGGWQAHVMDDSLGEALNELVKPPFAMLLGRTTRHVASARLVVTCSFAYGCGWPRHADAERLALPYCEPEVRMTARRFFSAIVVVTVLAFAVPTFAQKPANAPKNATGQCVDATFTTAKTKRQACAKHGGVKSWWGTPAVGKGATKPRCGNQRRGLGGVLAPKVFCD